jgi:hypothetical protein
MNNVCEVVVTTIAPIGSASLPFVIPSEAEGSAVLRTIPGNVFVDREIMALRANQGDENQLKGTAFRPSITEQDLGGFTGCGKTLALYQGTTLVGP